MNGYRLHRILEADASGGPADQLVVEVPIRIRIQWDRLTDLTR